MNIEHLDIRDVKVRLTTRRRAGEIVFTVVLIPPNVSPSREMSDLVELRAGEAVRCPPMVARVAAALRRGGVATVDCAGFDQAAALFRHLCALDGRLAPREAA